MTDDTAVPMDFSGANGIYFWELFFYMPYLVAWRLSQEEESQAGPLPGRTVTGRGSDRRWSAGGSWHRRPPSEY